MRGTASIVPATASFEPVHPRACGEQHSRSAATSSMDGSSPRVRGTGHRPWALRHDWFIPARAGNRVSRRSPDRRVRFIPARAGNSASLGEQQVPVHPRACGEQAFAGRADASGTGSSPRVRGTVYRHRRRGGTVHPRACGEQISLGINGRIRRFIPARAGTDFLHVPDFYTIISASAIYQPM